MGGEEPTGQSSRLLARLAAAAWARARFRRQPHGAGVAAAPASLERALQGAYVPREFPGVPVPLLLLTVALVAPSPALQVPGGRCPPQPAGPPAAGPGEGGAPTATSPPPPAPAGVATPATGPGGLPLLPPLERREAGISTGTLAAVLPWEESGWEWWWAFHREEFLPEPAFRPGSRTAITPGGELLPPPAHPPSAGGVAEEDAALWLLLARAAASDSGELRRAALRGLAEAGGLDPPDPGPWRRAFPRSPGEAAEAALGLGLLATPDALQDLACPLYPSPSPRDRQKSRMPSSA